MNIIYDCTILSNYNNKSGQRAGVFFTAYNILQELLKQGHNLELYCNFTEYYKIKRIKEFSTLKLVPEYSLLNKFAGIMFYLLSFLPQRLQPYINILTRIYSKYFYIKSKKKQEYINKFDAYFSPFTPASPEINEANIKRYRIVHDLIPVVENGLTPEHKSWFYWFNRIYNTINEKDYYFTDSEYTKMDLLKYFPNIKSDNVRVAYLGANNRFKPDRNNNITKKYNLSNDYVFSLCSLGKRKNLIFAITNFYNFIEKNNINNLELVLAGGIWKSFEKKLHNTLNLYNKEKIKVLGYIPDDDLPALYSNAIMFVYPSLYEGFGLPVLEAMQCGCPVITSNATSLPEVIGNAGIQVNPNSDEEMVAAYEKMYFDSTFRKSCQQKGLERAKQFSWEKCTNEIVNFIQSTL